MVRLWGPRNATSKGPRRDASELKRCVNASNCVRTCPQCPVCTLSTLVCLSSLLIVSQYAVASASTPQCRSSLRRYLIVDLVGASIRIPLWVDERCVHVVEEFLAGRGRHSPVRPIFVF